MAVAALSRTRFCLAAWLLVVLALGPAFVAPVSAAEGQGVIRGFLFQTDEVTRIVGAKVTAIDVRTSQKSSSNITGNNGAYEILGLAPGTYDIGIEVSGNVYVTDSLVEVAEGQRVTLSFAIQTKKPNRKIAGYDKAPDGTAAALTFKGTGVSASAAGQSFWTSPGGITLMSVLGAGLLFVIFDDDDPDGSPSSP